MKKAMAILIVLCIALTLFACGKDKDNSSSSGGSQTSSNGSSDAQTSSNQAGGNQTGGSQTSGTGGESGGGQPAGVTSARDSLSIAVTADSGSLDPVYTGFDMQMISFPLLYQPLWVFSEDYSEIKYILATKLDMIDPLYWEITLRDDVYFQDGTHFDADDAVFSLRLAQTRVGEPSPVGGMPAEGINKIDDYKFSIQFSEYFIGSEYTLGILMMYSKETYNADTASYITNGSGPYEVVDYVVNSHMVLKARDDYWGEPPLIKNITLRVLAEDAQRVNALLTNEVSISGVPYQDIEYVRTISNLEVRLNPSQITAAIYFNVSDLRNVFRDNLDARFAVAYAIDPQAILDISYNGYGEISKAPYSAYTSDPDPENFGLGIYGHGFDLELARELAVKSGLTDKEILLINNGSPAYVTACELIQANLKEIGVTVNLQSLDAGSWLSYLFDDSAWDMCIDMTLGGTTAASLAIGWVLRGGYANMDYTSTYPGKDRFNEIVRDLRSISDRAELKSRYQEACELHAEAMLYYSLVDVVAAQAFDKKLVLPRIATTMPGGIDYARAYWID